MYQSSRSVRLSINEWLSSFLPKDTNSDFDWRKGVNSLIVNRRDEVSGNENCGKRTILYDLSKSFLGTNP